MVDMQQLGALKRQTHNFIMEDPSSIVINRNAKVPDGAGGSTKAPTPLAAQLIKVSQQRNNGTERRNSSGEVVRPSIILVCEWDADIERDDTFTWNGLDCEVVWVTDLDYVKHGEVAVL